MFIRYHSENIQDFSSFNSHELSVKHKPHLKSVIILKLTDFLVNLATFIMSKISFLIRFLIITSILKD